MPFSVPQNKSFRLSPTLIFVLIPLIFCGFCIFVVSYERGLLFLATIFMVASYYLILVNYRRYLNNIYFKLLPLLICTVISFSLFNLAKDIGKNIPSITPIPDTVTSTGVSRAPIGIAIKEYEAKLEPKDSFLSGFKLLETATLRYQPLFEAIDDKEYRYMLAKDLLLSFATNPPIYDYISTILPESMNFFSSSYLRKFNFKDLKSLETLEEDDRVKLVNFILKIFDKNININLENDVVVQKKGLGLNRAAFVPLKLLKIDFQVVEEVKSEVKLTLPRGSLNKLTGYEAKEIYLNQNQAIVKLPLDTVEVPVEFSYFTPPFNLLSFLFIFFDRLVSQDGLTILLATVAVVVGEVLRDLYSDRYSQILERFLPFLPKQKSSIQNEEDFSTEE